MTQERFLEGRNALVTGASRGIGAAIAKRLALRGARVACVATTAERCEDTRAECAKSGGHADGARAYGVDVADTSAVADLVKVIQKELGSIDILVNNAGITRDGLLLRMSEEDFDRVIDVNLKGTWNFLRAAARPLMKSSGRVINISSIVGITGNAGQVNYAASKAGVFGLTRSMAKELASRGVCVNAIAPGMVETDMTEALEESARTAMFENIPLGRAGTTDEIALAVEFLAGPGGAYITGQTLVVDGGLGMGN